MNILAIADGKNDLIDISNQLGISLKKLNKYIKILLKKKLIIERQALETLMAFYNKIFIIYKKNVLFHLRNDR